MLRDVVSQIGGNTLKPANRDRFLIHATASAGGLARPVAHSAQDAGENVRPAIGEIRFGVVPLCDESDVLRHVSVCWASPLTIDDTMKILRVRRIGRLHIGLRFTHYARCG